ncbi:MAG: capsule assembly Wzi family protein, partial [Flavisolibacter sp.]
MKLPLIARISLLFLLANIRFSSTALSQSASLQFFDGVSRDLQVNGQFDSTLSFCVRPNYNTNTIYLDAAKRKGTDIKQLADGLFLLPLVFQQQYNAHHPYGFNDGSMVPAKGYQNQLSVGIRLTKSIFNLQVRPELVFAQNSPFPTFPAEQNDTIWKSYYGSVLNMIDAPERFGTGSYLKFFPGQSSARINFHKLSLGVSTENLWWGPGVRNSLLMSNNAPGLPHLTFNSLQPVTSPVGSFEWQVIAGSLKGSGIVPDTTKSFNGERLYVPKGNGNRYLNGVIFSWQPKWTKGLFVGLSRVFYQNQSDVPSSLDGYFPVAGKLFKKTLTSEDGKKRDQMLSFFFRLLLPKEKAELYGEFGRNDHSMDLRDALAEPEHSRAYIVGFSKTFDGS